jgi:hypothetical protein
MGAKVMGGEEKAVSCWLLAISSYGVGGLVVFYKKSPRVNRRDENMIA